MEAIDSLRFQARMFLHEQSLMDYESWAFGKISNQDSLYKANAGLFTRDNIALVTRAVDEEPDSIQQKRLRFFRRYLTLEYIAKQVASVRDRIDNYEAVATCLVNSTRIPYRQIPGLLANEQSAERRAAISASLDPIMDTLTVLHREAWAMVYRLAADLGYPTYNAMEEELLGFSLRDLGTVATAVLAETDSLYAALLAEQLQTLHMSREGFHRYDFGRLFRNERFDKFFPAAMTVEKVSATYRGLGLDLQSQPNLQIDQEPRPQKNPRAACFSIDVPTDIRVSTKPVGGIGDYRALFHEMGHAQHYANTTEHAVEFAYMGEPTVTETYAFLSEYLPANQAWLRVHSPMPPAELRALLRYQTFNRLYFVRRYCAKFLCEYQLHSGTASPDSIYAAVLSGALGYIPELSDRKRLFTDIDPNYYTAGYLRAWFLEAQLSALLVGKFGVNWFEHPDAGTFLRGLWAFGDRLDGNELVHHLGYSNVAPDAWLAGVRATLQFAPR
jgi:hypothetical protein